MSKLKVRSGYDHERDGFIDDNWHWIEGLKMCGTKKVWWQLYCFPKPELSRAEGTLRHMARLKREGKPLLDGVGSFERLRLHPAGEFMKAIDSLYEVRSIF